MATKKSLLIAVISDATTVAGLLLTGMGERNHKDQTNFMAVDSATTKEDIENKLKQLLDRDDIGIILIS